MGEGKEEKIETSGGMFSWFMFAILLGLFCTGISSAVPGPFNYLLAILASVLLAGAAIYPIIRYMFRVAAKMQDAIKKISLIAFTCLFACLAVAICVITWIIAASENNNEILQTILYWLIAAMMIAVSASIIWMQFLLDAQSFAGNPLRSYALNLGAMVYVLAYAILIKPDLVFKIAFTIHTLASLIVFVNIIFRTGIRANHILLLAMFVLSVVALMVQLVYCLYIWFYHIGNDHAVFNAIMGVFAGLLGGVLTISGVAWTIRHQEEIRREEMQQREDERKKEERAKAKPFFAPSYIKDVNEFKYDYQFNLRIDSEQQGEYKLLSVIENSDKSNFSIKSFWYDGSWKASPYNNYVLKNKVIEIIANVNKLPGFWKKANTCYLKIEDSLGNEYYYLLNFDCNLAIKTIYLRDIQEITKEEAPNDND